jgi:hypothetical protein
MANKSLHLFPLETFCTRNRNMEFWPVKIDWSKFRQHYKDGDDQAWILALEIESPCDVGSLNAALADVFPLMQSHLSEKTKKAIGPLVSAVCTCEIEGWPWPHDNPADWNGVQYESVGMVYSPETVKGIVAAFESVPFEQLASEIERAWSKMSKDPADYQYSEPHYFEGSAEFLEYLSGWLEAFKEAARQDHALGIGGG